MSDYSTLTFGHIIAATQEGVLMEATKFLSGIVGRVSCDGENNVGTCILYSSKYYFLTCNHVVRGAANIQVIILSCILKYI